MYLTALNILIHFKYLKSELVIDCIFTDFKIFIINQNHSELFQAFERWKEKKMEYFKEKNKKEKEYERAKKQKEEETIAEKRKDNQTAVEKW